MLTVGSSRDEVGAAAAQTIATESTVETVGIAG